MCVTVTAITDLLHRFQERNVEELKQYANKDDFFKMCSETAYQAERMELEVNCGRMDPYASPYGGLLFIDCGDERISVEKLDRENDLIFIVGDTKQPKDTPRILSWLGKRFRNKEVRFMEGVEGITKIVKEAKAELSKHRLNGERLGELMNENQYYLKKYLNVSGDCSISPSKLDKLIKASLDAGAYGTKITGSGGGGCMIALCERDNYISVIKNIENVGGLALATSSTS